MILLDSNVLSAMSRAATEPAVERWFDAQPTESVWTTSITVFEIHFGLRLLAPGRRREQLEMAFRRALDEVLGGRVLSFDRVAAETAAAIAPERQERGPTIEIRDVQIAGIAAARGASVATRNTRHFEATGIQVINPWNQPA